MLDEYPVAGEPWTEAEVQYLRANYQTEDAFTISAAMGRTVQAVREKARVLGLQKKRNRIPARPTRSLPSIHEEQERKALMFMSARAEGLTLLEVARKFGVTKGVVVGTVWRYRKRKTRAPKPNDIHPEKIKARGCCAPVQECDRRGTLLSETPAEAA